MAAHSMDLRRRIFDARQAGQTTAEVAARFAVCTAFVRRLLQRERETGSLAPKAGPRGPGPKLRPHHDALRACNAAHPDLTPAEVGAKLGLKASASTLRRAFAVLRLTFKKKPSTRPNATGRT